VSYEEVRKTNELFERYYNDLNIVPEGEERKEFWTAMRRELPNSFRFTGSKG
jgi:multisite-specific tRNA:(cytosine-C5)-methyltransferase